MADECLRLYRCRKCGKEVWVRYWSAAEELSGNCLKCGEPAPWEEVDTKLSGRDIPRKRPGFSEEFTIPFGIFAGMAAGSAMGLGVMVLAGTIRGGDAPPTWTGVFPLLGMILASWPGGVVGSKIGRREPKNKVVTDPPGPGGCKRCGSPNIGSNGQWVTSSFHDCPEDLCGSWCSECVWDVNKGATLYGPVKRYLCESCGAKVRVHQIQKQSWSGTIVECSMCDIALKLLASGKTGSP